MLKVILGIIGGLLLAFAVVFATDALFHMLAPAASRPPAGDAEAMRSYVARQPVGALVAILTGWALAAFAGSAFATRLAVCGAWPGWIVTILFLAATAGNFLMVPHPAWIVVAAAIMILAAGWLGTRLFAGSGNGVREAPAGRVH